MKLLLRIALAIVFATIAAGLALGLEAGIVHVLEQATNDRLSPRGAGWALLIIAAGVAGWKTGYNAPDNLSLLRLIFDGAIESRKGRMFIVALTTWILGWTLWANAFLGRHAYECNFNCGYAWDFEVWIQYLSAMFAIPVLLGIVYGAIRWINAGKG